MREPKLIAMIPARMGSKRIPQKNIRYIDGKPLIAHAIELAMNSGCFDSVWVNSEDRVLGDLAISLGANFHERPQDLATDLATNREFTTEFLEKHDCDYVVMVNTTSPTLRMETLQAFCAFVRQGHYDTILTSVAEQAETFYEFKPLNFSLEEKVNSQLLTPVEKVVWAMTAWRKETFLEIQHAGKNPIYGGKLTTFKIPKDESCDLDTEEDWKIADGVLRSRSLRIAPQYYSISAKANPNDVVSTPNSFSEYVDYVKTGLDKMVVVDSEGAEIKNDIAIQKWAQMTFDVHQKKGTVFFAGNGASATMAEHMSADLYKNGQVNTVSCSETAYLTAISNDIDFAEIFAFKIRKSYFENDLLITISSSGNSDNIIRAIEAAKLKNGRVVTLSGFKFSNKSRQLGDLNFFVPSLTYGAVEVAHSSILHCWLDQYLLMLNKSVQTSQGRI
ncbi:SIS domain-containing protein [Desulfovibrio sp. OttesenSCG-928-C06]|nr:SIS domain-containing protein [Desulfovibrio sp. OttesenSCG-928-C06]